MTSQDAQWCAGVIEGIAAIRIAKNRVTGWLRMDMTKANWKIGELFVEINSLIKVGSHATG